MESKEEQVKEQIPTELPDIVCIQLKTGKWNGTTPLAADDLGLKDEEIPRAYKLGVKRLYSDKEKAKFDAITGRGIQYLNRVGLPFVVNTVYMVPKFKLQQIVDNLAKEQADFHSLADDFVARFGSIKESWLAECEAEKPGMRKILEPFYPDAEVVRNKFKFKWIIFTIKGITAKAVDDEAILDAIGESKAQFEAQCEDMVKECIEVLRDKVAKTVQNLVDRIRTGKIVRNNTLESVKNIHEQFKELNIFGDTNVERSLNKLRSLLDGVGDAAFLKDNTLLQNQILEIADAVVAQSTDLSDLGSMTGRYKRLIELD